MIIIGKETKIFAKGYSSIKRKSWILVIIRYDLRRIYSKTMLRTMFAVMQRVLHHINLMKTFVPFERARLLTK